MADPASPAGAVLEALGFTIFIRDQTGLLRLHGLPPGWLRQTWKSLTTAGAALPIDEASPFLENFLIDAEESWSAGGDSRAQSGPWIEQTENGQEISLEATALTVDRQSILLLERLGEVFEAKKSMLQTARETVIAYQRLNSETQKKEILLSCIAEEMNAALSNAITSLRLIEREKHSARTQQLLSLAMRATEDQQALINKVLNVFASELEALYGHDGDAASAASLGKILPEVKETLAPLFAEKRVALQVAESDGRVAMDADHLARVVSSLLENGLQNAPAGGAVSLEVTEEGDAVVLRVCDDGAILPDDLSQSFFSKETVAAESPAFQVRLQFCRMAIEKSQGEMGHETREGGGNCFWIRLPKPAAAA